MSGKQRPETFFSAAVRQFFRDGRQICADMAFHFPESGEGFLIGRFPAAQLVPAAAANRFADFAGHVTGGFFLGQNSCDGISVFPDAADGISHIPQPFGQGKRMVGMVWQIGDQPFVQPAAVQKQKRGAAQKEVYNGRYLEQTCPKCDECHKREQKEHTGNEKTVLVGEISHQQTAYRKDQQRQSGFGGTQNRAACRKRTADHAAGTAKFLCSDQSDSGTEHTAGIHGGNAIAAECCYGQNEHHCGSAAVCGTERDLSGAADTGKYCVHKIGGTAGECSSHGIADDFRAAGVKNQRNSDSGEKNADSSAACHAGCGFSRTLHDPQADNNHQCKQKRQIAQHGVRDQIGDQAANENCDCTRCAEISCNGDGQRRSHGADIGSGEKQTGEESAAGLIENTGCTWAAEQLRTVGLMHDKNVLSLCGFALPFDCGSRALHTVASSIIAAQQKNICQNLLHHYGTICMNLHQCAGQSGDAAFPVSLR